jgi:hypothetical protein
VRFTHIAVIIDVEMKIGAAALGFNGLAVFSVDLITEQLSKRSDVRLSNMTLALVMMRVHSKFIIVLGQLYS